MHYTFFIYIYKKKHLHLRMKCAKGPCTEVYVDWKVFVRLLGAGQNMPVILSVSQLAPHQHRRGGGKYPNKQSRLTFDGGLPCHY